MKRQPQNKNKKWKTTSEKIWKTSEEEKYFDPKDDLKKNGNNLKKQYERRPKTNVLTQLERRPQNKIEDYLKKNEKNGRRPEKQININLIGCDTIVI